MTFPFLAIHIATAFLTETSRNELRALEIQYLEMGEQASARRLRWTVASACACGDDAPGCRIPSDQDLALCPNLCSDPELLSKLLQLGHTRAPPLEGSHFFWALPIFNALVAHQGAIACTVQLPAPS